MSQIGILVDSETAIEAMLSAQFKVIEAAGGVIYNANQELLFIFRNGKWDLPKGKIEVGESTQLAALREVEEECGIKIEKVGEELPTSYHVYTEKGKDILKKVYWYKMEYHGTEKGSPQTEEGITELKWVAKKDWEKVLENTYPSIRDLILLQLS